MVTRRSGGRGSRRARLRERARAGDVAAQRRLARDLFHRAPIRKREAVRWCRKAAEAGDADAQVWLALCYGDGQGVRKDAKLERRWYERAAAQGSAQALVNLGLMCARGEGGPRDRARANRLYRRSAALGNEVAMHNLGGVHRCGLGVRKDPRRAFEWYRRAAEGDVDSLLWMLDLADEHGFALDRRPAMRWLAHAARKGQADAQVAYGVRLFYGKGVRRDRREALRWYRRAARADDSNAWVNLGHMYRAGDVVRQSWPRAVACFRRAARLGSSSTPRYMAQYYERVAHAPRRAVRWLETAVARGDVQALVDLGVDLHNGEGVRRDRDRAARLYRRAAEQGHDWAMYLLGLCHRDGEGARRDPRAARRWFRRALRAGRAQGSGETVRAARKALAGAG